MNNNDLQAAVQQLNETYKKLMESVGLTPVEAKPKAVKVKPPKQRTSTAPHLVGEFIEWFIKSPEQELYNVRRGQWECKRGDPTAKTAHLLLFHSVITKNRVNAADVICIRPPGAKITIFNASRIAYGASYAAQKSPQAIAENCGAVPIPFENVVRKDMANLDLTKLELVEWAGSEKLIIPPVSQQRWHSSSFHVINRHFAGAVVVKIEEKCFLFDTDREELEWCGFNPFFTQLPYVVGSIKEAYKSLMPIEVIKAIENGKKVIRQGELFFVPGYDEEVRTAVCTGRGSNIVEDFFYDQFCKRVQLSAALTYNSWRYTCAAAVNTFLDLCEKNNAGRLSDSDIDAHKALSKMLLKLNWEAGPEQAHWSDEEWKNQAVKISWTTSPHECAYGGYIHEEIRLRLPTAIRVDAGTNQRIGVPADGNFPFLFGANIGENTGGQQQHTPTVMYCPEGMRSKNPVIYARGTVYHLGRQHRPVYLDGWYRVYPNTATANWTVSGDVD